MGNGTLADVSRSPREAIPTPVRGPLGGCCGAGGGAGDGVEGGWGWLGRRGGRGADEGLRRRRSRRARERRGRPSGPGREAAEERRAGRRSGPLARRRRTRSRGREQSWPRRSSGPRPGPWVVRSARDRGPRPRVPPTGPRLGGRASSILTALGRAHPAPAPPCPSVHTRTRPHLPDRYRRSPRNRRPPVLSTPDTRPPIPGVKGFVYPTHSLPPLWLRAWRGREDLPMTSLESSPPRYTGTRDFPLSPSQ